MNYFIYFTSESILLVLNFAILKREHFSGFYFRGFKLNDSSILNFVLFFKKDEVFSSQNWKKQNAYFFKYKLSLR